MRSAALLVLASAAYLTQPASAGGLSFSVSFGSGWRAPAPVACAPAPVACAPVVAPVACAPVVCAPVIVRQPVVCAPVACAPVIVPARTVCAPVVAAPVYQRAGWHGHRDRRAEYSYGHGRRGGRGHSH